MGGLLILVAAVHPVPRALALHAAGADVLGVDARLRADRLRRRLPQGAPPPLARALAAAGSCCCSPRVTARRWRSPSTRSATSTRRSTSRSSTSTSTSRWFYYPFLFLVIAGTANGVNLTDGLDGLAAGTAIISLLTLLAIAAIAWIRSGPVGRAQRRLPRPRDRLRRADRRRDRLPLVQRAPGRGVHGRHRLDGARRRDRRRWRS